MFTPAILTVYELFSGDNEYYLHSREGEEIVFTDLDPVAARVAEAIRACATHSYESESARGDVVLATAYLFS